MSDGSAAGRGKVKQRWVDLPEVLFILGFSLVARGVWVIYPPAAEITVGAGLMILALCSLGIFKTKTKKVN